MDRVNIGIILALVVAIAGGAAAFGKLQGRVESLEKLDLQKDYKRLSEDLHKKAKEEMASIKNLYDSYIVAAETRNFELHFERTGTLQSRTLWPEADACFLTKIGGKFYGGGEIVYVVREENIWYLKGHSRQPGVQAGAICIKYRLQPTQAS